MEETTRVSVDALCAFAEQTIRFQRVFRESFMELVRQSDSPAPIRRDAVELAFRLACERAVRQEPSSAAENDTLQSLSPIGRDSVISDCAKRTDPRAA